MNLKLKDMNELKKVEKTMSSRTIAELTGKSHYNVLRDIRDMEDAYVEVFGDELKFELVTYRAGNGEMRPEYKLTKSQTLFIVSGYDSVVRAKIQQRWEHLEATRRTDQITLPSRTELALQVYEALAELDQANETIALQAPKVEFVEEVFEAPDLFSVGTVAKMIGTGQNKLFAKLRARRVLKSNNEPYQTFVERGYFKTKGTLVGSARFPKVVSQTMVTTRGLAWIRLNIV